MLISSTASTKLMRDGELTSILRATEPDVVVKDVYIYLNAVPEPVRKVYEAEKLRPASDINARSFAAVEDKLTTKLPGKADHPQSIICHGRGLAIAPGYLYAHPTNPKALGYYWKVDGPAGAIMDLISMEEIDFAGTKGDLNRATEQTRLKQLGG